MSKKIAFGDELLRFSQWVKFYTFLYPKKIPFALLAIFLTTSPVFSEETYDIQLKAGDNFISLPLITQDANIANILSAIITEVRDAWEFNPDDVSDPWKHYQPGMEAYSDLKQMEAGKGYWINVKTNVTLRITGRAVGENPLLNLKQGWNVIGWPYQYSQEMAAALGALNFGTDYIQVSRFNNITQLQENFLHQAADNGFTNFEPGKAYYIYMLQNKVIRINIPGPIDTTPPQIIQIDPADNSTFYENDIIPISLSINDADSSPLEYQFSIDGAIKQSWSAQSTYIWNAATNGIHIIKTEIRDAGGQDTKEFEAYIFKKPIASPGQ